MVWDCLRRRRNSHFPIWVPRHMDLRMKKQPIWQGKSSHFSWWTFLWEICLSLKGKSDRRWLQKYFNNLYYKRNREDWGKTRNYSDPFTTCRSLSKKNIILLKALITGICALKEHYHNPGTVDDTFCRFWVAEQELRWVISTGHILALILYRLREVQAKVGIKLVAKTYLG